MDHQRIRSACLGMLVVPGLLLAACGSATAVSTGATAGQAGLAGQPGGAPGTGTVLSTPAGALPTPESSTCDTVPAFDAHAFPDVPGGDNPYLPLTPGMQYLLDGTAVGDDGKVHPHRIETTVTNLTKVVDGVRSVVLFDRDLQSGTVEESEIYFEAQDRDGTVWNLGEYPEEYANGKLTGAPKSWLPGVSGAHPGISMPAHPQTGTATYPEGIAPSVGFKDCATVVDTGRRTCAGPTCYSNVVVVDEYAPLQPGDGHQEKFLAPGVGTVQVAAAGGADPEALQLTSASRLCSADLARVDALALQEDQRAFTSARGLWGGTGPATQTLPAPAC
jgi:hypothetical protein